MKHAAVVSVSDELLCTALHFPRGTAISNIRIAPGKIGVIEMIVEHPDLPEVLEGNIPPEASPTISFEWNLI